MNPVIRLAAVDRVAVPWKNGGGVTRDVAASPAGAGMDDFDWRVSMAEVTQAGPFSRFDGVQRHLTVLRGRLRLDVPDRQYTLGPLDSLAFDGDVPVVGTPLEPVLDLNVMTRGKVSASVRKVEGEVITEAATALLIDPVTLDALRIDGGGRTSVAGRWLLVELT